MELSVFCSHRTKMQTDNPRWRFIRCSALFNNVHSLDWNWQKMWFQRDPSKLYGFNGEMFLKKLSQDTGSISVSLVLVNFNYIWTIHQKDKSLIQWGKWWNTFKIYFSHCVGDDFQELLWLRRLKNIASNCKCCPAFFFFVRSFFMTWGSPTKTSSRYFTSHEGFSPSWDVWYDSWEVVLPREESGGFDFSRGKNQTKLTSHEKAQNHTIMTSHEGQNQTIPLLTSIKTIPSLHLTSIKNHTITTSHE